LIAETTCKDQSNLLEDVCSADDTPKGTTAYMVWLKAVLIPRGGLSWLSAGAGPEGDGWVGMKTVAQLRRETGVGAPRNADSLYRNIERAPRKFNPLKIPRALQVSKRLQVCFCEYICCQGLTTC